MYTKFMIEHGLPPLLAFEIKEVNKGAVIVFMMIIQARLSIFCTKQNTSILH